MCGSVNDKYFLGKMHKDILQVKGKWYELKTQLYREYNYW